MNIKNKHIALIGIVMLLSYLCACYVQYIVVSNFLYLTGRCVATAVILFILGLVSLKFRPFISVIFNIVTSGIIMAVPFILGQEKTLLFYIDKFKLGIIIVVSYMILISVLLMIFKTKKFEIGCIIVTVVFICLILILIRDEAELKVFLTYGALYSCYIAVAVIYFSLCKEEDTQYSNAKIIEMSITVSHYFIAILISIITVIIITRGEILEGISGLDICGPELGTKDVNKSTKGG